MYVGRVKYYYEGIDLDSFCFEDLYSPYGMSCGTCTNVNFYYNLLRHPLDLYSLQTINHMSDFAILEMINSCKDVQVPINIYMEELDDLLLVFDPKGNILPSKIHVKEVNMAKLQLVPNASKRNQEETDTLVDGINFNNSYEQIVTLDFK
ncbi:hypothetical protein CDL12_24050 [Handroanthus impetiginosus]|uniref:Uncharacterized protein n=1 Tax=Handroanthus impetiginosus TaxID=429701 RepID=A0A2G9GDQ5_9LAMI|nr:hypothetical protein CDL12_24050 [Handroanthus impetiginosus]